MTGNVCKFRTDCPRENVKICNDLRVLRGNLKTCKDVWLTCNMFGFCLYRHNQWLAVKWMHARLINHERKREREKKTYWSTIFYYFEIFGKKRWLRWTDVECNSFKVIIVIIKLKQNALKYRRIRPIKRKRQKKKEKKMKPNLFNNERYRFFFDQNSTSILAALWHFGRCD